MEIDEIVILACWKVLVLDAFKGCQVRIFT